MTQDAHVRTRASRESPPHPAAVCQVLQEGRLDGLADPADYCECGGEVRRGFDWLLADHIRLLWFCETCGRFWRTAAAVLIGGTTRALSQQESDDWR